MSNEPSYSPGSSSVGSDGGGAGQRRSSDSERSADRTETSYAAQKAAKMLGELESRKSKRETMTSGTEVDARDLVERLSTGSDPRPALKAPKERGRLSVVLSPDSSPSTAQWSGTATDFAHLLSQVPNTDATVIPNSNGEWFSGDREEGDSHSRMSKRMEESDVMLYLGDKDGESAVQRLADDGHTVIALNGNTTTTENGDNEPYIEYVNRTPRGGAVYWVSGVPVDDPDKWTTAMGKVLQMLRS